MNVHVGKPRWSALLRLEREAREPLYHQLARGIRGAIGKGELPPGLRLPATRQLATWLGVHRNTVVAAYHLLEQEGALQSAVGAGTFVQGGREKPETTGASPELGTSAYGGFSWRSLFRDPSRFELDPHAAMHPSGLQVAEGAIQLTGAVPDSREFPMEAFGECVREVLAGGDPNLLEYGPPEGDASLREWIGRWLAQSGVPAIDPRRIFVISGSQQGIDLLAKLLLAPGDRVAIEEPTYSGAYLTLRHAGVRMVGVPVDEEGLSTAVLSEACVRDRVRMLYTMPCFQNPTGVSLGPARRAELLTLAKEHTLPIIEDHYDTPLYYDGSPPRPLLADDPDGMVIHLGTFSKILFPGLRLGWIVVPEPLCDVMRSLRWATDLSSGVLTQRIMDRFCRSGKLDDHLVGLRSLYGKRLRAMLQALPVHFPPGARWTRPRGGMTLWATLPAPLDSTALLREAAPKGVLFAPGPAFYPNGGGADGLRLTFNRETPARIQKGIGLLGELIRAQLRLPNVEPRPEDGALPPL